MVNLSATYVSPTEQRVKSGTDGPYGVLEVSTLGSNSKKLLRYHLQSAYVYLWLTATYGCN